MLLILGVSLLGSIVHLVLHAVEGIVQLIHLLEEVGVAAKETVGNEAASLLLKFLSGESLFEVGKDAVGLLYYLRLVLGGEAEELVGELVNLG